ncbi:Uncharacterised protein [Streptococcus pyogenes]|nr:Uncharacterised protein [Streptococcus pyogenes]
MELDFIKNTEKINSSLSRYGLKIPQNVLKNIDKHFNLKQREKTYGTCIS